MQKISKCRNKHNSTRTNLLREAMCGTQHVQIFGTLEHTLCWTLWGQSLWICVSSKNRKDSRRQVAYNGCIHESLITIKKLIHPLIFLGIKKFEQTLEGKTLKCFFFWENQLKISTCVMYCSHRIPTPFLRNKKELQRHLMFSNISCSSDFLWPCDRRSSVCL